MGIDRRDFVKAASATAALAAVGASRPLLAAEGETADLILTNGALLTMDDRQPQASAMAIRGGRILAVDAAAAMEGWRGPQTRVVDLGGRGVSPGLIDAHSHPISFGQMELMFVVIRPPAVDSYRSLTRTLRDAAKGRAPGEWVVARGFQEFKEGRWPHREDLDDILPKHPVLLIHWGGQFGIANSLALEQAGLLKTDVKNPYGGVYLRDRRNNLPNGVLVHYPAIYSVYRPLLSEDEQARCARWAIEQFNRVGVTCVHDNFVDPRYARTYVRLERSGELSARVRVYPYMWTLDQTRQVIDRMMRYRGPLTRVQGLKLAVDGYALMYDSPAEHRDMAIPMHPQGTFRDIVKAIHDAGLQVDVHAVGDKGVDWTLDAFETAAGSAAMVRERRHRIEHFPFRRKESIRRAAAMGVPVCQQPFFIDFRVDDFRRRKSPIPGEYLHTSVPLRTMLTEGVHLAFGADVPAFPSYRPLDSIRCAMRRVTGEGQDLDSAEQITFAEALRIHTAGNAYAAFDEHDLGTLTAGKQADFVVWNRDLRAVKTASDLGGLAVAGTFLAGRQVYAAPDAKLD